MSPTDSRQRSDANGRNTFKKRFVRFPAAFRLCAGNASVLLSAALLSATLLSSALAAETTEKLLFDFESGLDVATIPARDANVSRSRREGRTTLRVLTGHEQEWPGITLTAPSGSWDLSAFAQLCVDVANVGKHSCDVQVRVDSATDQGDHVSTTGRVTLAPGESGTVKVPLRRPLPMQFADKLIGMRGYPGGFVLDGGMNTAKVEQLLIFTHQPSADHELEIDNIRASGSRSTPEWVTMSDDEFFPMIDRFGQFAHKRWPGKIESVDDFLQRRRDEADDRDRHRGPDDWNLYGGWNSGPRLNATGHFRVEKLRGKWWFVDPEGRLFWSHGVDCVRSTTGQTPITDREFLFADLPERGSAFAEFFGKGNWAPHGYYQGKRYDTYNFTAANLLLKYGPTWQETFADLCHQRLRSWGLNTIGNWSDPQIYRMRRTPYTATISAGHQPLQASEGYWGKFPDVFDPDFRATLVKHLRAEKQTSAQDPWCIGYFVDNELAWGDEHSLAVATLASPRDQAAKRVFHADLKAKYDSIDKLNASWGSEHASWEALLDSTTPPDSQQAGDDLAAFYTRSAEQYFRTCGEAIDEVAPEKLYLGCRFAWVNDRAVRAAAKYCDVLSFNRYEPGVADFHLPEGVDKPAIIGEFHFGALDRGMFHTGLQAVEDQTARAAAYSAYVRGAVKNPWLVGTHWFQFGDQATTGRGDGENYQIGFLDIADTPYPEIIAASRSVGSTIYPLRFGDSP